jgi:hypothetical protein
MPRVILNYITMAYTKEQKKEYFQGLRERWSKAKSDAENDAGARSQWQAMAQQGHGISYTGFYFTMLQMRSAGLEGLPYIDCKTFKGWQEHGFRVRKGEKSVIQGLTWLRAHSSDDEEDPDAPLYPKAYALFHRSQVDPK